MPFHQCFNEILELGYEIILRGNNKGSLFYLNIERVHKGTYHLKLAVEIGECEFSYNYTDEFDDF